MTARPTGGALRAGWLPVLLAGLLASCGGYGGPAGRGLPEAALAAATSAATATNGQLPAPAAAPNSNEPVKITGTAEITFPLFERYLVEPYVLLEDAAGFVNRDFEFELAP
ncbi:MAG: hypothetical protein O3B38_04325, partial [Chloroflexi bacterium]|nr:hypothetical protein [Chloroflexota bacterium]